ncbi:hypothetical protein D9M71_405590 [compost metagenome]
MLAQRQVVHHRATAGVEQPGARPQRAQPRGVEQMAGGMRAEAGQRGMQADHVTLAQQLVQFDEIATLGGLPRRVADQHLPAQPAQHVHQPPADLAGADHAVAARGEIDALQLGQHQQAAQHPVHHAARIAARRAGPGDAGPGEILQVQVVGADGAGADEAHLAAFQQGAVDAGHRAHQQHFGVTDGGAVDATARHAADFAVTAEKGFDQGNVLIGKNTHWLTPFSETPTLPAPRSVVAAGMPGPS